MENISKEKVLENIRNMGKSKTFEALINETENIRVEKAEPKESSPVVKAGVELMQKNITRMSAKANLESQRGRFYYNSNKSPSIETALTDPEFVSYLVKIHGSNLEFVPEEMKNNKDLVLTAIEYNKDYYHTLENASKELRNDPEIVFAAVKANPKAIKYASEELQKFVEEKGVDKLMQPDEPIIVPKVESVLGKVRSFFNSNESKNKNKMG